VSFSHKNCSHPSTSKDRAACRKARADGQAEIRNLSEQHRAQSKKTRAGRERKATKTAATIVEDSIEDIRKRQVLRGAKFCYVCDKPASWVEELKDGEQPVCMLHVNGGELRPIR
jgi:hypothetical protein